MPDCPQKTICDDLRNRGYYDSEFGCTCNLLDEDAKDSIIDLIIDADLFDEKGLDELSDGLAKKLQEKHGPVTPGSYKKIARSIIDIIKEEVMDEIKEEWGEELPERPTEEELKGLEKDNFIE